MLLTDNYPLFQLYELDGSLHDSMWTLSLYEKLTGDFKKSHKDFIGVKFIFTSTRHVFFVVLFFSFV